MDVQCSPDGAFRPLQVQSDGDDELYHVVCVQPSDGFPIIGTEDTIADMDDAPDCDRLGEFNCAANARICNLIFCGSASESALVRHWDSFSYNYTICKEILSLR